MKRAGLTVLVAMLALMALPMAAVAIPGPSGSQDQLNNVAEGWFMPDNANDPVTVTQTYKAGITGPLTGVEIYCEQLLTDQLPGGRAQGPIGDVTVSVGSATASGSCGPAGWLIFVLSNGPAQTAGHTYTISIEFTAGHMVRIGNGQDYANGAAGGPSVPPDFAFGTWVGATPPPTGTVLDDAASSGAPLWLFPAMLACALGTLVVIRRKQTTPNN